VENALTSRSLHSPQTGRVGILAHCRRSLVHAGWFAAALALPEASGPSVLPSEPASYAHAIAAARAGAGSVDAAWAAGRAL